MYKRLILALLIILFCLAGLYYGAKAETEKHVKIGILLPIEHSAMDKIVNGFKDTLKNAYGNNIEFNVQNAQGDIKLQRSIIELFKGQNLDIIVPIGTSPTQMTMALVKDKPIISLAALYSDKDRARHTDQNMTGVSDEIGGKMKLDFIQNIFPTLNCFTIIIHSGNEKDFKEVQEIVKYGTSLNINVQVLTISSLPELSTTVTAIDQKSQALLILKDNVIASGIQMLVPVAQMRKIPLITSDEGTVQEGATLSLGVSESQIGQEGARLAIDILKGKSIKDMPIQVIKTLSVFYNPKACHSINMDLENLKTYARQKRFSIIEK